MTAGERVATALMLIPGALWAGVIFFNAVERVVLWARMPIDQFAVDFRRSVHRSDPMQPILGILSAVGIVWFALQAGRTAAALAWIALALYVAVFAISICFAEPINTQFRKREEGDAPPNAAELRARWRRLHLLRTVPTLIALVCLVLATTYA